ncbi:MAG: 50S ribosomal protein L11 methyltransferase [Candidatus Poribacteria bacterium]|nr:50S ribosomal protein L11 methyltransferase [Candidatus Poribacteria bacterium]
MKWAQVTVTTSQEASDAVANYLFELGATGLEVKEELPAVALISYFPLDDLVGGHVQNLRRFLDSLPGAGIDAVPAEVSLKCVEEENWSEQWRSAFPPQKIGQRLIITPTWHHITTEPSEILIQLDPGMAFGTGQHPTTQLSIQLLEEAVTGNARVADIGTGSGILAIAAAKLGAKRVDAVDLDTTAIPIAQRNVQLNDVTSIVHLRPGDGLQVLDGTYNLIIANILTKVILPMIPQCPQFLKPDGRLILSGIMASEAPQVEDQLQANGFRCLKIQQQEEWVGMLAAWVKPT